MVLSNGALEWRPRMAPSKGGQVCLQRRYVSPANASELQSHGRHHEARGRYCCGGGNDELCQTCCAYSYNATETRRGPVRRCVAWASSSASDCASEVPILEQAFEVFTCSPDGSTTSCQRACDRFEAQAVSHGVRTRHASPAALLLIAVVWAKTT